MIAHHPPAARRVGTPSGARTHLGAAVIRAALETAGQSIGPNDTLLAAIALANGLTVVTHNTRELRWVPGLLVEDWAT